MSADSAPGTSVVVSVTVSPVRAGAPGPGSIRIGHHQLFGGEQREQLWAVRGDHDLLLDSRRRVAVLGRAVRLQGEDHALLELDRVLERVQPAEDGPLV